MELVGGCKEAHTCVAGVDRASYSVLFLSCNLPFTWHTLSTLSAGSVLALPIKDDRRKLQTEEKEEGLTNFLSSSHFINASSP